MSRSSRLSCRTLTALTLLSAAALLSTTACSSNGDPGSQKQQPVRTAEPSPRKATPATDSNEADAGAVSDASVDRAPDLAMADRVVLRQDGTRDSASLEFGKAKKGDGKTVTIAVECEGPGKVEVVLRPMNTSFPMTCLDGEVSGQYNQFTQEGADRAGVVSVTADPEVRWSLSVGRGDPAGEDLSD
ncbi:hypothetical protein [Streptomyces sp. NBC_01314]|uniref:hypothetical protein n=1 Tax=Streptomyces sp. NBC_01314 TaxID=2903821 RepID=UPI0030855961|nr:hypothetical protein OG622_27865 [Streptomyces sp. NBC_01314]